MMDGVNNRKSKRKRLKQIDKISQSILNLPSHILLDILLELPIKTIVACKFVCKSWLQIISDPQFSKLHQARSNNIEVCLQRYNRDLGPKLYTCSFHSHPLDMKLDTLLQLPAFKVLSNNVVKYDGKLGMHRFVNSCNGLLCFRGPKADDFAFVWNPITNEFITFSAPVKRRKVLLTLYTYGLGFSQKVNRFKLLRVKGECSDDDDDHESDEEFVVEICTIEKGCSWRTVCPCPCRFWSPNDWKGRYNGSFLNGALHWLGQENMTDIIVSFDFEEEKLGKVPLPPPYFKRGELHFPSVERVGIFEGCLCIVDRDANIWLMKQYGVQDSWTRLFSFELTRMYDCGIPITYLDKGEILMRGIFNFSHSSLLLYYQCMNIIKVLGFGSEVLAVISYSPSLVLLKDSMMGYDVHVKPRSADMENKTIATAPTWWKPVNKEYFIQTNE